MVFVIDTEAAPARQSRQWERVLNAVYDWFDDDQAGFTARNALLSNKCCPKIKLGWAVSPVDTFPHQLSHLSHRLFNSKNMDMGKQLRALL
jgi:hypothetical protein